MLKKNKFIYSIASLALILCSLLLDNEVLRGWFGILLGVQLLFAIGVSKDHENRVMYFFSPSFLSVLYVNFNAFIGGYSLFHRFIIEVYQYRVDAFYRLDDLNISVSFFLLCSWIAIIVYQPSNIEILETKPLKNISNKIVLIILSFLLIVLFSVIEVDLSFLGGSGSFSTIPKTLISIILFYELAKHRTKNRWVIYLLTFCVFVFTNFESKRETFFLMIPIVFIESFYNNINILRIDLKRIIVVAGVVCGLSYSILIMTIARGFGQYEIDSPIESINYIPNLIQDFDIVSLLFSTSEAPTTTYHSLKAISLINSDPQLLSYGSTYAKVLFIPFPKEIFMYKPVSIIGLFTMKEDLSFYNIGGSLPVNLYSESYWNFFYFGFIIVALLLAGLNMAYFKLCKLLSIHSNSFMTFGLLFSYTYLLSYYRGCGLDMYFVYVIIAFFFAILLKKIIYGIIKLQTGFYYTFVTVLQKKRHEKKCTDNL